MLSTQKLLKSKQKQFWFFFFKEKKTCNQSPVNLSSVMGQIIKGLNQILLWRLVVKVLSQENWGYEPRNFPCSINACPQNHKPPNSSNMLLSYEHPGTGSLESPLLKWHRSHRNDKQVSVRLCLFTSYPLSKSLLALEKRPRFLKGC